MVDGRLSGSGLGRTVGWAAVAVMATLTLGATACGEGPTGPGTPDEITELPRALTQAERSLLEAGNRFGLDLLGVLAPDHRDENLFFSPLSASMALGMVLNGARGDTHAQMAEMLGYGGLSQAEINASYATLLELLQDLDPAVRLEIANAVWHRTGMTLDAQFVSRVRASFDAEVAPLGSNGVQQINDWVDEKTNGTIEKLYDSLPANLVALLANAVYFKGDWTQQFDRDRTRSGAFDTGSGTVTADFMHQEMSVRLAERNGHTVVELPYGGQAFVMSLVLPAEGTDPADVVTGLTPADWAALVGDLGEREAMITLPKFELEWERKLNGDLQALGMVDAFDPGRADLSGMVPGGGVWVDEVKQKSFVRVDEEGTEAAAVTGVAVVESASPSVRFDRPFVLAIRERLSGTILFLGVVRDPS